MAFIHDIIAKRRQAALDAGHAAVPDAYQGVTRKRVEDVLKTVDRFTPDQRDAVFALLDNIEESWYHYKYKNFPKGFKFCDGATTAHVACHFGIWQRGESKSDREGRDYWLKPLWEIGAMEKVFFDANTNCFVPGHPVAKSNYTAYRLAPSFKENRGHS